MIIAAGPAFDGRMWRLRYRINAAGMSGLLSRTIYGRFALMSASSDANDRALRDLLVESGYGFFRFYGLFVFGGPAQAGDVIEPLSLLVPALSQTSARELAQVCGQGRYLWGQSGTWRLLRTATGEAITCGHVEKDFRVIRPAKTRTPKQLRVWRSPEGPVAAQRKQCWLYCLQIDHFSPPVGGPPLFGILQEGDEGASWFSPGLCDALVPLSG